MIQRLFKTTCLSLTLCGTLAYGALPIPAFPEAAGSDDLDESRLAATCPSYPDDTQAVLEKKWQTKHDAAAAYSLGMMLADPEDDAAVTLAQTWFERAAEGGHVCANLALGDLFANIGTPESLEKAFHYYEVAEQAGSAMGAYQCALLLDDDNRSPQERAKAISHYEKAAKAGLSDAQFDLASFYERGRAGTPDLEKARHWYTVSAQAGRCDATLRLAEWQYLGKGGPVNKPAALKVFLDLAQNHENVTASFYAGQMMIDGDGVPLNLREGLGLLRDAAAQQLPVALVSLAALYEKGKGVEKDPERAQALRLEACEAGLESACPTAP